MKGPLAADAARGRGRAPDGPRLRREAAPPGRGRRGHASATGPGRADGFPLAARLQHQRAAGFSPAPCPLSTTFPRRLGDPLDRQIQVPGIVFQREKPELEVERTGPVVQRLGDDSKRPYGTGGIPRSIEGIEQ